MLGSGWDKKGLGPTGSGKLYPVKTVLKKDRRGLGMASEDGAQKKGNSFCCFVLQAQIWIIGRQSNVDFIKCYWKKFFCF